MSVLDLLAQVSYYPRISLYFRAIVPYSQRSLLNMRTVSHIPQWVYWTWELWFHTPQCLLDLRSVVPYSPRSLRDLRAVVLYSPQNCMGLESCGPIIPKKSTGFESCGPVHPKGVYGTWEPCSYNLQWVCWTCELRSHTPSWCLQDFSE